jgi:hypothetical protein
LGVQQRDTIVALNVAEWPLVAGFFVRSNWYLII